MYTPDASFDAVVNDALRAALTPAADVNELELGFVHLVQPLPLTDLLGILVRIDEKGRVMIPSALRDGQHDVVVTWLQRGRIGVFETGVFERRIKGFIQASNHVVVRLLMRDALQRRVDAKSRVALPRALLAKAFLAPGAQCVIERCGDHLEIWSPGDQLPAGYPSAAAVD